MGIVGFRIPKARPATKRPTTMRGTPLAAAWKTAPTMVKNVETSRVFLRPSFSRRRPLQRQPIALPADPSETIAPVKDDTLAVPGGNMYSWKAGCARVVAIRPRSIPTTAPPMEMMRMYHKNRAVAFIIAILQKTDCGKPKTCCARECLWDGKSSTTFLDVELHEGGEDEEETRFGD